MPLRFQSQTLKISSSFYFVMAIVNNSSLIYGFVGYNRYVLMLSKAAIVVICLCMASVACKIQKLLIKSVQRNVVLTSNYPMEQISIKMEAIDDGIDYFHHLIPLEYDSHLVQITFSKNARSKAFKHERSVYIYNSKSYALYKVHLENTLFSESTADLYISTAYLNRYVNFPESITLTEDQKFLYEDYKYVVSPYKVNKQTSTYKFTRILNFDKDGSKKGLASVVFTKQNIEPYSVEVHTVHGVNNSPQIMFSKVERIVEVSHWGNIALTEHYYIKNVGPTLKGEFNRLLFSSKSQADARNAFTGIQVDLPYEIWGLYYRDEVGNISTSRAHRDHNSGVVKLALVPRFALLGGWKANWEVGYNVLTSGFLFQNKDQFELKNLAASYSLSKILAEEYVIKVILPEGASDVQISIGNSQLPKEDIEQEVSFGYLDFQGRPTYSLKNVKDLHKDKGLSVTYRFESIFLVKKLLILFGIILSVLLSSIMCTRLKLDAFSSKSKQA